MLILIGSFSLLAASTSCRRTSITASLCLLVSMASNSVCAADDLVGKKQFESKLSREVMINKLEQRLCSDFLPNNPFLLLLFPLSLQDSVYKHKEVDMDVIECSSWSLLVGEQRLPCETPHRKKLKLAKGTSGMFSIHLKCLCDDI